MSSVLDVLEGRKQWHADHGDCLPWLRSLPTDSISLIMCSPPYERARLYLEGGQDLGVARDAEQWVAWMIEVVTECVRVCKGLCAFVVEGQTRDYRYSCSPVLLMADLHRRGFNLRKPPIYRRNGIPGSGGPDWLRNDYEPIVCVTKPGRLVWSDNTACGHPPKWAPGGEMSNRQVDGVRVNGKRTKAEKLELGAKRHTKRDAGTQANGDAMREQAYLPPDLANPGNVVQQRYTAEEVAAMIGEPTDIVDCTVGGGRMGSDMASDNEAPYPEDLAAFFVRSFCPEGGVVCDPFMGSGTTLAVALKWGRRAIGCDLRQSQVDLTTRRIKAEAVDLFTEVPS